MLHTLSHPHRLYLLLAGVFGLLFLLITPPFAASDETAHFERSYEIAQGRWLGLDALPAPLLAFKHAAFDQVKQGRPFTREDYAQLMQYRLAEHDTLQQVDPYTRMFKVHNPLAYIHTALAMQVALAFDAPLLLVFYACRLAAWIVGITLITLALRLMPYHRYALCAVALLPTMVFYLGMLNPESLNVALAFLFFALIMRHRAQAIPLRPPQWLTLALIAFGLAQCKTAYMLLPFMAFLLPAACFHSRKQQGLILTFIIVPGLISAILWAMLARHFILANIGAYATEGGSYVMPDEQMAFILQQPLAYAQILFTSLFASALIPDALRSFIGVLGWGNLALPIWCYAVTAAGLGMLILAAPDRPASSLPFPLRLLATALVVITLIIALTLLYMQWTGVQAPLIQGFQGRYCYALLPWLLCWLPPHRAAPLAPRHCAILITAISVLTLPAAIALMVGNSY